MTKILNKAELQQFTGSENWYRHALVRTVLFTDGAKYVADQAGAHWLLDEIALMQRDVACVRAERFQTWKLTVRSDHTATLACENGDCVPVFSKEIAFTDFPGSGIELWCIGGTILLPSEY